MKDVAALAGVSLSTVSRVVGGGNAVDPALAERVHAAAAVLGYRRNHTASTLRRADRQSASIGLIWEDVANPFFSAVHRGVEEVARQLDVLTFVGSSDEDPERERTLAEAFCSRGVDGLIIAPAGSDQSYLVRDRDAGVALVFVDRPPRLIDADAIVSDNALGVQAGVEQLLANGHRRIAFLGGRRALFTAQERLRGYRDALRRRGVEEDPALVMLDLDDAAARRAVHALLQAPQRPTALFTAQNLVTIGAVDALHRLGVQHEIALIGYDDVALAGVVDPPLSVLAPDPVALGHEAANLLFSRLEGHNGPGRRVVVPTAFIRRGSGELAAHVENRTAT
jgi:LacI family transcriptional regulator